MSLPWGLGTHQDRRVCNKQRNRTRRMMATLHLHFRSSSQGEGELKGEENEGTQRKRQIIVNKQDTANVSGTRERLLCLGCAQTLLASNASSCTIPIRLHILHLPFHQLSWLFSQNIILQDFSLVFFVKSTNSHHYQDAPNN